MADGIKQPKVKRVRAKTRAMKGRLLPKSPPPPQPPFHPIVAACRPEEWFVSRPRRAAFLSSIDALIKKAAKRDPWGSFSMDEAVSIIAKRLTVNRRRVVFDHTRVQAARMIEFGVKYKVLAQEQAYAGEEGSSTRISLMPPLENDSASSACEMNSPTANPVADPLTE